MRFMVMVKANKESEADVMPTEQMLAEMGKYNQELLNAGVLIAGEGLHPSSRGARVRFNGADRQVIPGPFDSDDLVAGFWIFDVSSLDEAVEWIKRCPNPSGAQGEIEIRGIFSADDFGAELTPELRRQEESLRAALAARADKA